MGSGSRRSKSGGHEPSAKQLRALVQRAKAQGIKTVFVQPEFDRRVAEAFARRIGGQVVSMNGLPKTC